MYVGRISVYNNYLLTRKNNRNSVNFSSRQDLSPEMLEQINDLKVFNHHIYEYQKGLRNLILTTEKSKHSDVIKHKLEKNKIDYVINEIGNDKINVFFGEKDCVNVAKKLNPKLSKLSPEEDFILGIMLGYDRVKQCSRYLKFKEKQ